LSFDPRFSAPQLWESILGQLLLRVSRQNYDNWLKDTAGLRFEGTALVVGTPSELACDWLATRLRNVVSHAAKSTLGPGITIRYEAMSKSEERSPTGDALQPILVPEQPRPLNPRFTFASLVEGNFNRFAVATARELLDDHASSASPLLVVAPPGCGKTHLLHAIAHEAQARGERFLLVNAEQFLGDYATASRLKSWPEFRARYRGADLLLVDDIQALSGKTATQAEFHQTLVALQDSGRRVIVTASDSECGAPATRTRWAIVAQIAAPSVADRVNFVQVRAAAQGISIPDAVVQYIALQKTNVRDLEGAFNQVTSFARITGEPITVDFAARAMHPFSRPAHRTPILHPPAAILEAVCSHFDLSVDDLRSAKRTRAITHARHVAMYLLRQDASLTHKSIAQLLVKKDHSTVVYACGSVEKALRDSPELRSDIDSIRTLLTQSTAA
jgi:chromosomal replication initiator protein